MKALRKLADWLFRGRVILWVAGAAGAIAFGVSVTVEAALHGAGLFGLIAVVWSGYLLAIAHFFGGRTIAVAEGGTLLQRVRRAVGSAVARVAAILLIGLGGVIVAFTLKAISASR